MSVVQVKGTEVEIDEDGFLVDPEDWSEDMAAYFATVEDVAALTEKHWHVIHYLRDYFKKFGVAPMVRKLCKDTGLTLKEIYELFPSGPAKGA